MNKMFQWFAQAWTFFCMGTAIGFGLGACSVRTVEDPKGAPAKAAAAKDTGKPSPTPDGTDTAKNETTTPTDPSLPALPGVVPSDVPSDVPSPAPSDKPADSAPSEVTPPAPVADAPTPIASDGPAAAVDQETNFLAGLTLFDKTDVRLFTAEEAKAKADEIRNLGKDFNLFTEAHAFLTSLEDPEQQEPLFQHPFRDKPAVDKAIELVRGGFDVNKLRDAVNFLHGIRNADAQPLITVTQALDHGQRLIANATYDLDKLRSEYEEVLAKNPGNPGEALHTALSTLNLPLQ